MAKEIQLKRVVVKEELVALTGDYIKAILLNQFIYWSERTKDTDRYIAEEKERIEKYDITANVALTHGWIYKSAEELSEETMIGLSASGIRRHLKSLIDGGWINVRNNPNHKWDRTLQYRVDIIKIQYDLFALGYALEGYKLDTTAFSKIENGISKIENQSEQNRKAIPEITSETTLETKKEKDKGCVVNNNIDTVKPFKGKKEYHRTTNEVLEVRSYFEDCYYNKYYKRYTRHKAEQDNYINENLQSLVNEYDTDIVKEMIKNYFKYNFDHNLNHFIEEGIIQNRFYEIS